MSRRLGAMVVEKYADGFKVRQHEAALAIPFGWKKPAMVFVNSMSDLFHKDVPLDFIQKVFAVMNANPHLIFQVLTKRSERLAELHRHLTWSQNIWMGVSVEDERVTNRIDDLRKVPAAVRFLSCEPLIGPLRKLNLKGIDWVIVGGESGASPRPMKEQWATSIRDQCEKYDAKNLAIGRSWEAAWEQLSPFFHFPPEIRKIIYTTNTIESLNSSFRKISRHRNVFPTIDSLFKLFYLSLQNISARWTMAVANWPSALSHFTIEFVDRMPNRN